MQWRELRRKFSIRKGLIEIYNRKTSNSNIKKEMTMTFEDMQESTKSQHIRT